jgi:hypothetical protein
MATMLLSDESTFVNAKETINQCTKEIEESIKKQNSMLRELVDESTWKGKTRNSAQTKISELEKQTNTIPTTLNAYVNFLDLVLESYKKSDTIYSKNASNLSDGN